MVADFVTPQVASGPQQSSHRNHLCSGVTWPSATAADPVLCTQVLSTRGRDGSKFSQAAWEPKSPSMFSSHAFPQGPPPPSQRSFASKGTPVSRQMPRAAVPASCCPGPSSLPAPWCPYRGLKGHPPSAAFPRCSSWDRKIFLVTFSLALNKPFFFFPPAPPPQSLGTTNANIYSKEKL